MELKRQIKQLKTVYTEIIKRLVDPLFQFSEGGATNKTLANFLGLMVEQFGSVTESRLVDVCIYIAYIYRESQLPIKSRFGKASLKRFTESKRGQRYYENEWLATKELSRDSLLSLIFTSGEHPMTDYLYMPAEEDRKKRLHNQRSGFLLCQISTTGWSPLSKACQECVFTEDCKKETEKNFPELFRLRLENGNNAHN